MKKSFGIYYRKKKNNNPFYIKTFTINQIENRVIYKSKEKETNIITQFLVCKPFYILFS